MDELLNAQPQAEDAQDVQEVETPSTESTEQTTEEKTDESVQTVKIKYNHEEKEIPIEEAVTLAQKGMNYDKKLEELENIKSDKRLSFVENMAEKYGMSVEQYMDAIAKQEEQRELNELIQKNIPEEIAQEILENRKYREEQKTKEQQRLDEEVENEMFDKFLSVYKDVKPEDIPQSVWEEVEKGVDLTDAYTKYENTQLKAKIAELTGNKEIEQKNTENAQASTGSVTGKGSVNDGYFTKEQVDNMTRQEVSKNYDKIMESMKHWK